MATRGIYVIDGVRCYNHWDNYPEGTTLHLLDTIKKHRKLDLFSIVRSMEGLELIDNSAGEDYQYFINNEAGTISVYSVDFDENVVFMYEYPIEKFINMNVVGFERYQQKQGRTILENGETLQSLRVIKTPLGYATVGQLEEDFKKLFKKAGEMLQKGHNGNSSSTFKQAFDCLRLAGLELDKNLKSYYEDVIAPYFVKAYGHENPEYFLSYIKDI